MSLLSSVGVRISELSYLEISYPNFIIPTCHGYTMALSGGLRGENGTVMCERATGHRQGCHFSWPFANVPQFTDCQAKDRGPDPDGSRAGSKATS